MKGIILVMDGMAGRPLKELNNQTTLQAAKTPNMDKMAKRGITGLMDSIAPGIIPGSDTAHLSILGYNPYEVYTGRGPFEAVGVGVDVIPGDIAFRCNFSTSDEDGIITDRRAGRIRDGTDEIIATLNTMKIEGYEDVQIIFKESTGHRAVLVLRGEGLSGKVSDADPKVEGNKPKVVKGLDGSPEAERTADILNKLVAKSYEMTKDHPINLKRIENGEAPANIIIPRGAGEVPEVESINDKYEVNSACFISRIINVLKLSLFRKFREVITILLKDKYSNLVNLVFVNLSKTFSGFNLLLISIFSLSSFIFSRSSSLFISNSGCSMKSNSFSSILISSSFISSSFISFSSSFSISSFFSSFSIIISFFSSSILLIFIGVGLSSIGFNFI